MFSLFGKKNDDGLRGPSIEALRAGHRVFYGEYSEGPARGTRVLATVESSRRTTKRLVEANAGQVMFPKDLDVLVLFRSVGPGSYTLFPDDAEAWDLHSLGPWEGDEWLSVQPIRWFSHQESKIQEKDFDNFF
ncbi:hypothetical protein AUR04nite_29340 [Glutamicibacter uratoxydans]|uniref:Uncharacterized protein n=1 Tax=Glutamicibacter uratoxydans TaxID=43667 RepID=A0A4Y4DPY3_GLUUR|nr:hypothetical protein [Glutamicibacter uratoxydans]GED07402.1 hypothetical protein AUR04nite_29340 [Glutamicibacter uratoxydans]